MSLTRCAELARKALGDDATVELLPSGTGTVRGRDYFMQFFAATPELNLERIEKEMILLPRRMVLEAQGNAAVLAASSPLPARTIGLMLANVFAVVQELNLDSCNWAAPVVTHGRYRKMLRELDHLLWENWTPPFRPCIPLIAPVAE